MEFRAVPLDVIRGTQVLPGDFHGAGSTDLLIGSRFVAGCCIASGREDGTFAVRQTGFPSRIYFDIALADVDGDRRDDLIASCGDVFLRRPAGSLSETPSFHLSAPPGEPEGWGFMAAADFDADGRTDIALLANGKDGALVWLYRNAGNPREPFAAGPDVVLPLPGAEVNRDGPVAADFDGDGVTDLVLAARGNGACVLTGSRTDGLSAARTIAVKLDYAPHFDTRFGVADFDGDGKPDLAGFGSSPTGAPGAYIRLQGHPGPR
jgi:hypothetical protein